MKKFFFTAIAVAAIAIATPASAKRSVGASGLHPDCNITMPCQEYSSGPRSMRTMRVKANPSFGAPDINPVYSARRLVRVASLGVTRMGYGDGIGPNPGYRVSCGWMMQHETGITSGRTGLNLNLARNWRYVGSPGNGSAGEIFSQYGHVSRITGPGSRPGYVMTVSHRVTGGSWYRERRLSSGHARRV